MTDKATPTPSPASVSLYEQLRSVPEDAILKIDTPNPLGVDTRSIPVGAMCHEAAAEVERLAAQAAPTERDAKDAARYRLLRRGQKWSTVDGIGTVLRAETLDAAIDAAMAKD